MPKEFEISNRSSWRRRRNRYGRRSRPSKDSPHGSCRCRWTPTTTNVVAWEPGKRLRFETPPATMAHRVRSSTSSRLATRAAPCSVSCTADSSATTGVTSSSRRPALAGTCTSRRWCSTSNTSVGRSATYIEAEGAESSASAEGWQRLRSKLLSPPPALGDASPGRARWWPGRRRGRLRDPAVHRVANQRLVDPLPRPVADRHVDRGQPPRIRPNALSGRPRPARRRLDEMVGRPLTTA